MKAMPGYTIPKTVKQASNKLQRWDTTVRNKQKKAAKRVDNKIA